MANAWVDRPAGSNGAVGEIPPRTIIVKVLTPDDPVTRHPGLDPLEEIRSLADTRGFEVVASAVQRRPRPHSRTYVGKGKIEELKALAAEKQAQLLLVDDPLSPRQSKQIEDGVGIHVIDRTELIMDIFATHARSHQAKLQVELAQLRYSGGRLKRMWTHLSRYEGGIGMRGPGETQLETDRRLIKKKIRVLQDKLEEIEQQINTQHKGRDGAFHVALLGYTNAGKSSLLHRLTGADVLIENRLFSTLDTCTRRWELPTPRQVILTDTVGFIRNLPHQLVASFHATLMQAKEADLLLHIVDGSTSHVELDLQAVDETLRAIDCADRPRLLLFNKTDLLTEDRRVELDRLIASYTEEAFAISVRDGRGIEAVTSHVLSIISADESVTEYRLPIARGDLLARLREAGTLIEERYENDAIVARVLLLPDRKQQINGLLARNGITLP